MNDMNIYELLKTLRGEKEGVDAELLMDRATKAIENLIDMMHGDCTYCKNKAEAPCNICKYKHHMEYRDQWELVNYMYFSRDDKR